MAKVERLLGVMTRREGVAQAAADEAALEAPPSPPPEPVIKTLSPLRSRRSAAAAQQLTKKGPTKATAGASPRRKSKLRAKDNSTRQQQKLVLPDEEPTTQPPFEPVQEAARSDAEAVNNVPAELSAALAVWQQFEGQAKPLVVGRAQSDNMVQLLSSQAEGKQPEQVVTEVRCVSAMLDNTTTVLHKHKPRPCQVCLAFQGCTMYQKPHAQP